MTNHFLPATFYTGDAFGIIQCLDAPAFWASLLGIGIVWFAYLRLHAAFNETVQQIALKFQRAAAKNNRK